MKKRSANSARRGKRHFPFHSSQKRSGRRRSGIFSSSEGGDARTQSAFFSAQAARLNALREQSAREAKARGELYLKLGLLAGLALVVLIL